jgi:hypothetical protein
MDDIAKWNILWAAFRKLLPANVRQKQEENDGQSLNKKTGWDIHRRFGTLLSFPGSSTSLRIYWTWCTTVILAMEWGQGSDTIAKEQHTPNGFGSGLDEMLRVLEMTSKSFSAAITIFDGDLTRTVRCISWCTGRSSSGWRNPSWTSLSN